MKLLSLLLSLLFITVRGSDKNIPTPGQPNVGPSLEELISSFGGRLVPILGGYALVKEKPTKRTVSFPFSNIKVVEDVLHCEGNTVSLDAIGVHRFENGTAIVISKDSSIAVLETVSGCETKVTRIGAILLTDYGSQTNGFRTETKKQPLEELLKEFVTN